MTFQRFGKEELAASRYLGLTPYLGLTLQKRVLTELTDGMRRAMRTYV